MTYLLPPRAADAWYDLSAAYEKTVGKKDVQPPYRALDSVLRAVHGDWVRWLLHGDGTIRIVARTQIDPEDLQDVLTFWAEAVLPGPTGEQLGQLLGDIAVSTAPIPGPAPLTNAACPPARSASTCCPNSPACPPASPTTRPCALFPALPRCPYRARTEPRTTCARSTRASWTAWT
ncbi:hypothetical protein [Streptomyces sp. NPDC000961]|uniref:hypothetical protein n=1 Tax=Streptomyces sp. NPDC000961 TaxID=3364541 RepID=UPI0036AD2ABC